MKKILLIGKLNHVVKETNTYLSQFFHVQLCSENAGVLEGMLKIVNPDLVVISLIGAYDIDTSIFFLLSSQYSQIPVLTVGTKEESKAFFKYYENGQFENLIRPVEHTTIMEAVCRRLGIDQNEAENEAAEAKIQEKQENTGNPINMAEIIGQLEGCYYSERVAVTSPANIQKTKNREQRKLP